MKLVRNRFFTKILFFANSTGLIDYLNANYSFKVKTLFKKL